MNIEDFNSLNDFQKKRILAIAAQAEEEMIVKREVLKCSRSLEKNHSVVFIAGDIAIIENDVNPTYPDAAFTFAINGENGWEGRSNYYGNHEEAYLGALGYKHQGPNSQFAHFAAKMLQK